MQPPKRASHNARRRGQATIEYVLVYLGAVLPITFMIVFTSQLLWIWHSANELSRNGLRYAATHCWQAGGDNVLNYMRANIPPMIDQEQFANGPAELVVEYFSRDPETGGLVEFACDGGDCSTACVPDAVTVRVRGYEFRRFVNYIGVPPIQMPEFTASGPMEGAGCSPDSSECLP